MPGSCLIPESLRRLDDQLFRQHFEGRQGKLHTRARHVWLLGYGKCSLLRPEGKSDGRRACVSNINAGRERVADGSGIRDRRGRRRLRRHLGTADNARLKSQASQYLGWIRLYRSHRPIYSWFDDQCRIRLLGQQSG